MSLDFNKDIDIFKEQMKYNLIAIKTIGEAFADEGRLGVTILHLHDKMKEVCDNLEVTEEKDKDLEALLKTETDTPIQRGIKENIAIKMLKENGLFEEYEKRVADYTLPCGG